METTKQALHHHGSKKEWSGSQSAVIARLKNGERLRTGYTFTAKAWFDNGDVVLPATMKRLRKAGIIEQDRDGFIKLTHRN